MKEGAVHERPPLLVLRMIDCSSYVVRNTSQCFKCEYSSERNHNDKGNHE